MKSCSRPTLMVSSCTRALTSAWDAVTSWPWSVRLFSWPSRATVTIRPSSLAGGTRSTSVACRPVLSPLRSSPSVRPPAAVTADSALAAAASMLLTVTSMVTVRMMSRCWMGTWAAAGEAVAGAPAAAFAAAPAGSIAESMA